MAFLLPLFVCCSGLRRRRCPVSGGLGWGGCLGLGLRFGLRFGLRPCLGGCLGRSLGFGLGGSFGLGRGFSGGGEIICSGGGLGWSQEGDLAICIGAQDGAASWAAQFASDHSGAQGVAGVTVGTLELFGHGYGAC